jgi:peroxiredoxin
MQELLKRFIVVVMVFVCSTVKAQSFILKGFIEGKDTGAVVLSFRNADNKSFCDTAILHKGAFKFIGTVNVADYAFIDTDTSYYKGDNRYSRLLFIEPGEVTLSFKYGDIGNAKITGSKTQLELDEWRKVNVSYTEKIKQITLSADSVRTLLKNGMIDPKVADEKTKQLQSLWIPLKKVLLNNDISYIVSHKNSCLSLSLLKYSIGQLSTDSIDLLYSYLPDKIKNSSLGYGFIEYYSRYKKAIGQEYAFEKIVTGQPAPDFVIHSKSSDAALSLKDFKGSVILLEFWGLYCMPCLKLNPFIEGIRKEHSEKIKVIAISNGSAAEISEIEAYISKSKLHNWYHVSDHPNSTRLQFNKWEGKFEGYQALEVPRTVVIDENGKVIYKSSGFSWEQVDNLKKAIDTALHEN